MNKSFSAFTAIMAVFCTLIIVPVVHADTPGLSASADDPTTSSCFPENPMPGDTVTTTASYAYKFVKVPSGNPGATVKHVGTKDDWAWNDYRGPNKWRYECLDGIMCYWRVYADGSEEPIQKVDCKNVLIGKRRMKVETRTLTTEKTHLVPVPVPGPTVYKDVAVPYQHDNVLSGDTVVQAGNISICEQPQPCTPGLQMVGNEGVKTFIYNKQGHTLLQGVQDFMSSIPVVNVVTAIGHAASSSSSSSGAVGVSTTPTSSGVGTAQTSGSASAAS